MGFEPILFFESLELLGLKIGNGRRDKVVKIICFMCRVPRFSS